MSENNLYIFFLEQLLECLQSFSMIIVNKAKYILIIKYYKNREFFFNISDIKYKSN